MNKCLLLIQAITILQRIEEMEYEDSTIAPSITAIQFEDGSGTRFNYQVNGGEWKFKDLSRVMYR
jgi:hypothetical protein